MTSFWDDTWQPEAAAEYRGGFRRSSYDVAIVGGGIIGISTAIELKEQDPDLQVVVIERSFPPQGASTRNAGFACFGSVSEIAHDVDLMGAERARDLVRRRLEGLVTLRKRCGDEQIDYEQHGGHEIFLEPHPALDRIDEINTLLEPLFQAPVFERRDDLIHHLGFSGVHALVRTPFEGTLHSGKMMLRLWQVAEQAGVEIHVGEVVGRTEGRGVAGRSEGRGVAGRSEGRGVLRHFVTQDDGHGLILADEEVSIQTRCIVLATNALVHAEEIEPGRGQILLTEPVIGLPLRGSFHMNEGYVYFRNVGNRILLGGGRDIAMEEEHTTEFGITDTIQQYLEDLLANTIAPGKPLTVERRWSGIMGFREDKQPFVGEVAPGIVQAFGCNGMGVALGSSIGAEVANFAVHGNT